MQQSGWTPSRMLPQPKISTEVFVLTKATANRPSGFLTFTLHAHLPYVVNHGTWPHGMEWLHEAAAETYLPFLRMLKNLERDKIRFNCNINLSPILLEQLSHPVFIAEFPNYLNRKIVAAREDEAFFIQSGETHLAETARFWHRFFSQALEDFNHFDHNIIAGIGGEAHWCKATSVRFDGSDVLYALLLHGGGIVASTIATKLLGHK